MNIGSLFIKLGVTGANKAVGSLNGVSKRLGDVSHSALLAKAAILGAFYATSRMLSSSSAAGQTLAATATQLGINVEELQKYQAAARMVGATNDDVSASFAGLQSTFTRALMGDRAEGLNQIASATGAFSEEDIRDFMRDPTKAIKPLMDFMRDDTIELGLRNEAIKSLGLTSKMIEAITQQAFTPSALASAGRFTLSGSDIKSMQEANRSWAELGLTMEHAVNKFNAVNGKQLAEDMLMVSRSVIELTENIIRLANELRVFEHLSNVLKFASAITSRGLSNRMEQSAREAYGSDSFTNQLRVFRDMLFNTHPSERGDGEHFQDEALQERYRQAIQGRTLSPQQLTPTMPNTTNNNQSTQSNVTVNQNLNFRHDGRDASRLSEAAGSGAKRALTGTMRGRGN